MGMVEKDNVSYGWIEKYGEIIKVEVPDSLEREAPENHGSSYIYVCLRMQNFLLCVLRSVLT